METPALFASGTIPAGGTIATAVGAGSPPFSIQLNSTNAGRAIALSMDGGAHFITMPLTATVAGAVLLQYNGPIGQVLFSGASGDTYDIQ